MFFFRSWFTTLAKDPGTWNFFGGKPTPGSEQVSFNSILSLVLEGLLLSSILICGVKKYREDTVIFHFTKGVK